MHRVILTKADEAARAAAVVNGLRRFCALSSGQLVHECIQAPPAKDLAYPLSRRAKRFIHDSQISVW